MPADPTEPPSAYSRLPERDGEGPRATNGDRVRAVIREGTGEVARGISRGLDRASEALAAPKGSEVEALLDDTNLPEIAGADALVSLAVRLDREGDLWRNLAFRQIARVGWADRIVRAVALIALLGDAALAGVAGVGGLFGAEWSAARALLVLSGAAVLAAGALVTAWASSAGARAARDFARDAMARADLAELRLHRVALVLARRDGDADAFRSALDRLERDAAAPGK